MPDPTESVITATFCSALGVFAATAVIRGLLGMNRAADPCPAVPADETPPPPPPAGIGWEAFEPPVAPPLPETPRASGVDVSFFRPFDLLGLGFVFLLFAGLVVSALRAPGGGEAELGSSGLIASIVFQFVSAGIVIAFVALRVGIVRWLGLRWSGWPWVFVIAPATVVAMWILFAVLQASGYMDWIRSLGVETVQDTVKLLQESSDPGMIWLMTFAAVIAAPVCEEIVFRGYLYGASKRFAGPWVAGLCSALVFGAAHGSLAALLPLFLFGCVLAFLYEKTGSIWAPMSVHLCFNAATVLIQLAARYYQLPLDPPT